MFYIKLFKNRSVRPLWTFFWLLFKPDNILILPFLFLLFILAYFVWEGVFMWGNACMSGCVRSSETTCGSPYSPSAIWVPGIKLRPLWWAAILPAHIHPSLSFKKNFFIKKCFSYNIFWSCPQTPCLFFLLLSQTQTKQKQKVKINKTKSHKKTHVESILCWSTSLRHEACPGV